MKEQLVVLLKINIIRFALAITAVLLDSIVILSENQFTEVTLAIISAICFGLLIPNPNTEKEEPQHQGVWKNSLKK